jgi:hypothetical protein
MTPRINSSAVGILGMTVIVLGAAAIFEGIIITWLILTGTHFVIKNHFSPIPADSPISLALRYDAPDKKFDDVVKQNLG